MDFLVVQVPQRLLLRVPRRITNMPTDILCPQWKIPVMPTIEEWRFPLRSTAVIDSSNTVTTVLPCSIRERTITTTVAIRKETHRRNRISSNKPNHEAPKTTATITMMEQKSQSKKSANEPMGTAIPRIGTRAADCSAREALPRCTCAPRWIPERIMPSKSCPKQTSSKHGRDKR